MNREELQELQQGYDKWERDLLERGKAQGWAQALVIVLEARGIVLASEEREQILAIGYVALLEHLVRRAVYVTSIRQLFG